MTADNIQTSERSSKRVSYVISIAACLVALIHLARPQWAIDTVTLVLLVVAVLPWLASIFHKVKVLDWFEVEFQDLKREVKAQKQKAEELNVEVKRVAAQDEFRASVTIQLQKLLFLTNQHEIELERYLRNEAQLQRLISEATRLFPDAAERIKRVTPDTTARATFQEVLKESHRTRSLVDEMFKLVSDPQLTAVSPDLSAQIGQQIENTAKQLAVTRNLNVETEKVIEQWRDLLNRK